MTSRQRPDHDGPRSRLPLLPAVLAVADAALLLLSVGIWVVARIPLGDLTAAYLLGNAAIGAGFALGGALITLRVRRNAVGWLMLGAGTPYVIATAVGTVLYLRLDSGDTGAGSRAFASVYTTVWMPAVAICLPLAVQLFPTGRPINRFWRPLVWATVVGGLGITANWVLSDDLFRGMGLDDSRPVAWDPPGWLLAVIAVATVVGRAAIILSLLAPLFRLVRRPGEERLQVLWLVWAALVVILVNASTAFAGAPPPLPLFSIPLIPLAMTAAVLKYRLFGITLVINRTVVYLALTAALLVSYFAVVYGLSRLIAGTGVRQVLATGAVAVAFAPLRALLQRLVDRLMFGSGADPYGALAELGRRLQSPMTPDQVLPAVATTVADALNLPYVSVRAGRPGMPPVRTIEQGTPTAATSEFPLTHHGEKVGSLVVGVADRRHGLSGPRRILLQDLVLQAGPAVHSVVLTEELLESRQRTIAALEDERTRIRRDLHDGLGPALTGVVLKAEAARNLLSPEPARAGQLMTDVSEQTRAAVDEIRRLVYGLRPPALDSHGLSAALHDFVERLGDGAPAVELDLPPGMPRLGPTVEVAAYRIVTEALANVVRHSSAASARARLWVEDDALHLEVGDDGATGAGWVPGVGLTSMRERTEQLGGGFAASGSAGGGLVAAWLPLAAR